MCCNSLRSQEWIAVICSLVYITVDCLLSMSSNRDLFPLILTFFTQYNPSHIPEPLFTPCSWTTVKQFVWIGLHESDMLLSQNLFHILKRVFMYGC
jgi:hypothetical protein